MSNSPYAINYGKNTVRFSLIRRERKAIKISVLPDLSIEVIAPPKLSIERIREKVQKRAKWIFKNLTYFKSFLPKEPPRQYVSGETHRYLGRQYRLRVILRNNEAVKLKRNYIYVYTRKEKDKEHNKSLLYRWYKDLAVQRFHQIASRCLNKLRKYSIERPPINVKLMKSRWGSCSKVGRGVLLNTDLIKTPSHCIEYVIMHELCHLRYPNHDRKFYNFLSLVMPDWEKRKDRLEKSLT